MLDAFDRQPTETEEDAVRRSQDADAVLENGPAGVAAIGVWGAVPMDGGRAPVSSPEFWQHQRIMAASVLMAPLAAAQASTLAVRKARSLGKQWNEALARCKSMDELIDVNRDFGEKAMSLGAGEMWRFVERASLMGRATAAPASLKERNAKERAEAERR